MGRNLNFVFGTDNAEMIIKSIKLLYIVILTYFTNFKIIDRKIKLSIKEIYKIVTIIFCGSVWWIIQRKLNYLIGIMSIICIISFMFSINNIRQAMITTIISFAINYMISFLSVIISYVLNKVIKIDNDYINLIILLIIHILIIIGIFRIKRFKYGITSIKNNKQNEYIDVLILNISFAILFVFMALDIVDVENIMKIIPVILITICIMCITILKSLRLYYKQKLLIQELEVTKTELINKENEIKNLEQENLNFSEKSHTLAHKQRILKHKLDELSLKTEIADEISIREDLNNISKELYNNSAIVKLTKTGIEKIDDVLKYMQFRCTENKIDFNLQIIGNIYHMVNNIITKEELEILIADHVEDAIIAINHTDNINRSILVKIGKVEECYGLYIYDSGIEFEEETLENLGKKPITTHASEGGTGMGFMNTFDTLRKNKASLIIKQLGKPSKENYTKIIMIKFDNKNEFKVI